MVPALRLAAILLGLAVAGGNALARPEPRTAPPVEAAETRIVQADFAPLEDVLDQIRAEYPGHQLSVSGPTQTGNGYIYEIKWLTDEGAVLYIVADAETGSILSVDGG